MRIVIELNKDTEGFLRNIVRNSGVTTEQYVRHEFGEAISGMLEDKVQYADDSDFNGVDINEVSVDPTDITVEVK